MNRKESTALRKGAALEEVLRLYFLKAGHFVVRGVPFTYDGSDLTDVDLWMYERPTGASRRISAVDAKSKQKPRAVERLLWTKGLVAALGLDGAYVATTDQRPFLRALAVKLGLSVIDGADLKRIQVSAGLDFDDRLTDEELIERIQSVDKSRRSKELQSERAEVLTSLSDGFGVGSLVRGLECFSRLSASAVAAHPGSPSAAILVRLSCLAAAIAVASLDYLSASMPFRSTEEKREMMIRSIRYGQLNIESSTGSYGVALSLIRKYAGGGGAARTIESRVKADFERIPAEIVADQAVRQLRDGLLFNTARELESCCYASMDAGFDSLSGGAKGMIGSMLDYSGVSREAFALATGQKRSETTDPAKDIPADSEQQRSIF